MDEKQDYHNQDLMEIERPSIKIDSAMKILEKIQQQWLQLMERMRNDQRKAEEKLYEELLADVALLMCLERKDTC